MKIKDEMNPLKNEIIDEKKPVNKPQNTQDEEITFLKERTQRQNKKINQQQIEIAEHKECLHEKDTRLTRIEERWNITITSSAVGLLFLIATTFIWTIGHIYNSLPPLIEVMSSPTSGKYSIVINDWFLFLGFWAIMILAIIGFLTILYFIYCINKD